MLEDGGTTRFWRKSSEKYLSPCARLQSGAQNWIARGTQYWWEGIISYVVKRWNMWYGHLCLINGNQSVKWAYKPVSMDQWPSLNILGLIYSSFWPWHVSFLAKSYSNSPTEKKLLGGFNLSEKYDFVSWDDEVPIWKVKKNPWFQTTNQSSSSSSNINPRKTIPSGKLTKPRQITICYG